MDEQMERLVVRMAKENPSWGYTRVVGALKNLGYRLSHQTVGNILHRHGIPPATRRKQTVRWKDFIRSHMEVLAGTDFFTVEVLTLKG
jgi:transposase